MIIFTGFTSRMFFFLTLITLSYGVEKFSNIAQETDVKAVDCKCS